MEKFWKELSKWLISDLCCYVSWNKSIIVKTAKIVQMKLLLFRHDVDRRPENAMKMAVLERELGVTSRMKSTDDVIGR